ncbi:MAG TPA: hypothetical protein VHP81_10005 [Lachnospiraceae bacterium]|nr:hypothetical protein [Lachnospiraceae bacterium]
MQEFGYVRQLALKKKEFDIQIKNLKQQLQSQIAYQTAGAHANMKPNIFLYLGVIGVSELFFWLSIERSNK